MMNKDVDQDNGGQGFQVPATIVVDPTITAGTQAHATWSRDPFFKGLGSFSIVIFSDNGPPLSTIAVTTAAGSTQGTVTFSVADPGQFSLQWQPTNLVNFAIPPARITAIPNSSSNGPTPSRASTDSSTSAPTINTANPTSQRVNQQSSTSIEPLPDSQNPQTATTSTASIATEAKGSGLPNSPSVSESVTISLHQTSTSVTPSGFRSSSISSPKSSSTLTSGSSEGSHSHLIAVILGSLCAILAVFLAAWLLHIRRRRRRDQTTKVSFNRDRMIRWISSATPSISDKMKLGTGSELSEFKEFKWNEEDSDVSSLGPSDSVSQFVPGYPKRTKTKPLVPSTTLTTLEEFETKSDSDAGSSLGPHECEMLPPLEPPHHTASIAIPTIKTTPATPAASMVLGEANPMNGV